MAERLISFVQRLHRDRAGLERELASPLLIWDAAQESPEEFVLGTESGVVPIVAEVGQPVVLEVKKRSNRPNPFTMGITVGRVAGNDIVIPHRSVSRFHAYFRQDPGTKAWGLVDAESKNGTWSGPLRLRPSFPENVPDCTRLQFGAVQVVFYLPPAFLKELTRRMNAP